MLFETVIIFLCTTILLQLLLLLLLQPLQLLLRVMLLYMHTYTMSYWIKGKDTIRCPCLTLPPLLKCIYGLTVGLVNLCCSCKPNALYTVEHIEEVYIGWKGGNHPCYTQYDIGGYHGWATSIPENWECLPVLLIYETVAYIEHFDSILKIKLNLYQTTDKTYPELSNEPQDLHNLSLIRWKWICYCLWSIS